MNAQCEPQVIFNRLGQRLGHRHPQHAVGFLQRIEPVPLGQGSVLFDLAETRKFLESLGPREVQEVPE